MQQIPLRHPTCECDRDFVQLMHALSTYGDILCEVLNLDIAPPIHKSVIEKLRQYFVVCIDRQHKVGPIRLGFVHT